MSEQQQYFNAIGEGFPNSVKAKMMGHPCFKLNKKIFVFFYEECMVFKLTGQPHQKALELDGATLFSPYNDEREMKNWVQLPFEHKDKWADIAEKSAELVNQE